MYICEVGEIFRVRNLRVCIFPMDHCPPHVHVIGPGAEAKFRLEDFACIYCNGFKRKAIKEISEFLQEHQTMLWEAWNENQEKK